MAGPDRITSVTELTADWLTAALRAGGVLSGGASVTDIDVTQIAEGVGIASLLYRLAPTYRGASGPATMILKVPTDAADTRAVVDAFDFYLKECRFYAELAASTPVETAEIYFLDVDPDSGDFVIVMEDMTGVRMVDQIAGCTAEDAFLAIEVLADIHAAWWEPGPIDAVGWLPRPQDPPYPQALEQQVALSWPRVIGKHGELVPPEVKAVGDTFHTRIPALMTRLSEGPTTLVHGDYRLDNLLFPSDERALGDQPANDDGDRLTVIDWQICLRGKGACDTGYFMSQSLEPGQRFDIEQDLLGRYHDRLITSGVTDYSFKECWDDYRLGLLYCLVYPASGEAVELVNDRAIELFRTLLERSCRAIVETGALELL